MSSGKRKRGRPPSVNPRKTLMMIKCTEDEIEMFKERAKLAGMSLSEYVRARVKGERT